MDGVTLIKVKTGNFQKQILLKNNQSIYDREALYKRNKAVYKNKKFDLVLYATPPITFEKVVSFVKKEIMQKHIYY
ncbi:hypothetical protein SNF32_10795 [Enterococcus mundtii]|nr:hypothetical protein [Enterococcus mundtii]